MNGAIKTFSDLDAWKISHKLVLEIYTITKKFSREELYGVTSQIRRAAASITANIAEGFARYHFKDKARFYYQSRGSLAEVQNFLILAKDLQMIEADEYGRLEGMTNESARLLNGLIRSVLAQ